MIYYESRDLFSCRQYYLLEHLLILIIICNDLGSNFNHMYNNKGD